MLRVYPVCYALGRSGVPGVLRVGSGGLSVRLVHVALAASVSVSSPTSHSRRHQVPIPDITCQPFRSRRQSNGESVGRSLSPSHLQAAPSPSRRSSRRHEPIPTRGFPKDKER